ncbi:MAG TPA: DHH family phosphoesterase [Patescibacteria group bacterium]|nr:DHH family phosphoesterase [Patescibacteria group bacterium]
MYDQAAKVKELIDSSKSIVIIQADNPDADSLGSALALEEILGDTGKEIHLYCGVDIPSYLRYMDGWDRIDKTIPNSIDLSIFVDVSTMTLLEKLVDTNEVNKLKNKPCIVLDHHEIVQNQISFASVTINDSGRASAGELIYLLTKQLGYKLNVRSQENIMSSILGDTQGLSNKLASPQTYRIMADIIEAGVDRPAHEEKRRQLAKMPEDIYRFKANLINKTNFAENNKIAYVSISQDEINKYSPLYNPAPLIQSDMLMVDSVMMAIVFKIYSSGKFTAAIKSNQIAPVANKLAENFGGGGHSFASGFKIDNEPNPNQKIKDTLVKAIELLSEAHETI